MSRRLLRCLTLNSIILFVLLLLFAFLRLYNLEVIRPIDYDEGVYLETAKLLNQGYELYSEIFCSQPPYFIWMEAFFLRLFGDNLFGGRFGIVLFSICSAVIVYLISREISGSMSALLSLALLTINPVYLVYSRAVMGEIPCVTLGALAVYLALRFARSGKLRYLLFSGASFSISMGMKFLCFATIIPILVLSFLIRDSKLSRFKKIIILMAGLAAPFLPIFFLDLNSVLNQLFFFHMSKPRPDLLTKLAMLVRYLLRTPMLPILGLIGFVFSIFSKKRIGITLGLWVASLTVTLILLPQPIWVHHLAVLMPGLAVLAAPASEHLWQLCIRFVNDHSRRIIGLSLLALLTVALLVGGFLEAERSLAHIVIEEDEKLTDAAEILKNLTRPSEMIITDNQFLAFVAGRLVPPELCDTSWMRIKSGLLTEDKLISILKNCGASTVIFWTGRLKSISGFYEYVLKHYRLLRFYDENKLIFHGMHGES